MDVETLYEEDIETWAEMQIAALRRLSTIPGAWSNVIDWENLVEEIGDLGSERRRAAESLLELVFLHLLKLRADAGSLASDHWRAEVATFLERARARATRSMRGRIDLDGLWRDSLERARRELAVHDRVLPSDLPSRCPFGFEELLDAHFDPVASGRLGAFPEENL